MTSNDVSALPPELTRSGRLDTIWYFGMPTEEERKEIFRIHFGLKNKEVTEEQLEDFARETDKYTGAEIKEIVKTAIRYSFNRFLETKESTIILDDVLKAKEEVIPVSVSYEFQIKNLEEYAKTKARYASKKATAIKQQQIAGLFD